MSCTGAWGIWVAAGTKSASSPGEWSARGGTCFFFYDSWVADSGLLGYRCGLGRAVGISRGRERRLERFEPVAEDGGGSAVALAQVRWRTEAALRRRRVEGVVAAEAAAVEVSKCQRRWRWRTHLWMCTGRRELHGAAAMRAF